MNIKEAREIYDLHKSNIAFECGCIACEPNTDCYEAKGLIESHEKAEGLVRALEEIIKQADDDCDERDCILDAKEALERYGEGEK